VSECVTVDVSAGVVVGGIVPVGMGVVVVVCVGINVTDGVIDREAEMTGDSDLPESTVPVHPAKNSSKNTIRYIRIFFIIMQSLEIQVEESWQGLEFFFHPPGRFIHMPPEPLVVNVRPYTWFLSCHLETMSFVQFSGARIVLGDV